MNKIQEFQSIGTNASCAKIEKKKKQKPMIEHLLAQVKHRGAAGNLRKAGILKDSNSLTTGSTSIENIHRKA